MPRQNTIHNPPSLRELANRLRQKAKLLDEAATDLARAAVGQGVSLAYQQTIEDGLLAIELMAQDVSKKIMQGKFVDGAASRDGKHIGDSKKPSKKSR